MLKFARYDSKNLKIPLSGRELTGMFPWEVQWLIAAGYTIPGDILEIGTYKGATARELALAFPHLTVHCVDIVDPSYGLSAEQVGEEAKSLPNVRLTIADSKEFAYPPGLGMVLIDGNHSWNGVRADTERALGYFRGRRGLIVWHDYDPTHEVMSYLDWMDYHSNLEISWVQATMLAYLWCG